jgi:hypothetical protein
LSTGCSVGAMPSIVAALIRRLKAIAATRDLAVGVAVNVFAR